MDRLWVASWASFCRSGARSTNSSYRGHVCGRVANELCTACVEKHREQGRATVLLSLTDPFTARSIGVADPWGMRNFGRDADFAEQYLNTDDIAPSTNEPLPLCYCYDVTTAVSAHRSFCPAEALPTHCSTPRRSSAIKRPMGYPLVTTRRA